MKDDIFKIIEVDIFNVDLLIFYSKNPVENLHKHLNLKKNKHISDWLKKVFSSIPELDGAGGIIRRDDNKLPCILYLKKIDKKAKWSLYETLVHETNHIVESFAEYMGFEKEVEFKAYLQEYLFRKIRKLI